MTDFLLRLFVKDLPPDAPEARASVGKLAGTAGICCNLLLFAGKLLAGFLSGSIAIIADAVNNLTDAASSVITILGFRLARRPADRDHPYGHARYEYLSALAVSAIILLLGVELAKSSLKKILQPEAMDASVMAFLILGASIAVKLWMFRFYGNLGSRIHSGTLKAAALDSRNDVVATSAVFGVMLLYRLTGWNADGIAGIAVAGFILASGIRSLRETVSPLLGTQADGDLVEQLSALVLSHEKVMGIHDLLIHDYGPGQCFASVHAEVSAEEDTLSCHDLLDDIEEDALERLNVHLVIHWDPVLPNDPELQRFCNAVSSAARTVDARLSVHDVHRMEYQGEQKLAFDLEVPYDMETDEELLRAAVEEQLNRAGVDRKVLIHFDRKE